MSTVSSSGAAEERADAPAAEERPTTEVNPNDAVVDGRELVDIGAVLRRCLDIALRGSDIESRINLPKDLLPAVGDEVRFQGVFIQLLLNTRRPGVKGGHLQVTGRNFFGDGEHPCSERESYVHVCICDTRSGARENEVVSGTTYFRAGDVNKGLRLAVARSIVEDAGGWLQVSYAPCSGASINVYLPAVEPLSRPCSRVSQ